MGVDKSMLNKDTPPKLIDGVCIYVVGILFLIFH